jgi:hypothetical protein
VCLLLRARRLAMRGRPTTPRSSPAHSRPPRRRAEHECEAVHEWDCGAPGESKIEGERKTRALSDSILGFSRPNALYVWAWFARVCLSQERSFRYPLRSVSKGSDARRPHNPPLEGTRHPSRSVLGGAARGGVGGQMGNVGEPVAV